MEKDLVFLSWFQICISQASIISLTMPIVCLAVRDEQWNVNILPGVKGLFVSLDESNWGDSYYGHWVCVDGRLQGGVWIVVGLATTLEEKRGRVTF